MVEVGDVDVTVLCIILCLIWTIETRNVDDGFLLGVFPFKGDFPKGR